MGGNGVLIARMYSIEYNEVSVKWAIPKHVMELGV